LFENQISVTITFKLNPFDPVLKEKPKKIVVKGSWDNWAGETQLHLHDDANKIFKAFIALN